MSDTKDNKITEVVEIEDQDDEPEIILNSGATFEKFKHNADELFKILNQHKKLSKLVEQYSEVCKKYMEENKLDVYKTNNGRLTLHESTRNAFNKKMIENIEQYYTNIKVLTMLKSSNI